MAAHGIRPIDLLVVNLYPFEATVAKGADFDDCIENIDIGGPAMIRAAAKNHADVTVVVERERLSRACSPSSRRTTARPRWRCASKLAAKAYARTAAYDAAISNWFAQQLDDPAPDYRRLRRAPGRSHCATARTRTRRPRSIARRIGAPASPPRGRCRASSSPTTTSTTPTRPTNASPSSIPRAPPPASSSSTPIRAASPKARACSRPTQGAGLRSGLGLRRHRRAQPHARCRGGARHHRDLHRGDHRARRDRGGDRDRRGEEEPAPAAGRRPARSARRRASR